MILPLLENADLKDKRVLLRLDFDHLFEKDFKPGKKQKFNIAKPTLKFLLNANSKVVIAPSFNKINKKNKTEYSIEPYARYICDLFKCNVYMTEETVGNLSQKLSHDIEPGSILFIENLFDLEDEKNADKDFAEQLSMLGDIYVNEAFSLSGEELSSNSQIIDFYSEENIYPGLNFASEYSNMLKLRSSENLFTLCINNDNDIAGSLEVCENLIDKVDRVLLLGELSQLYLAVKNEADVQNYPKKNVARLKKLIKSAEVRNIDLGNETGKIFKDPMPEAHVVFWLGDLPNDKEGDLVDESAKIYEIVEKFGLYVIGSGTDNISKNKSKNEGGFFKFQSSCYNTFVNSVTGSKLPAIEKLEAKFR